MCGKKTRSIWCFRWTRTLIKMIDRSQPHPQENGCGYHSEDSVGGQLPGQTKRRYNMRPPRREGHFPRGQLGVYEGGEGGQPAMGGQLPRRRVIRRPKRNYISPGLSFEGVEVECINPSESRCNPQGPRNPRATMRTVFPIQRD